ncbi:hypothetical protein [Vibrio astriarenae]|nr:hypothetical protein [Vibrio astriarenae]
MPLLVLPFLGGGALGAYFGFSMSDGFNRLTWFIVLALAVFLAVKLGVI